MELRAPPPSLRAAFRARGGIVLALLLVLAACGRSDPPDEVTLDAVVATSATSFRLTFSGAVGGGADDPANYLIRDPDGVPLPVVGAHPQAGGREVDLTTEPQRDVAYRVTVRNLKRANGRAIGGEVASPDTVQGSSVPAPFPARAVALSNTLVLVTFEDPARGGAAVMNDDALDPATYRFGEPALEVVSAAFSDDGQDRSRVLLTTSSMADATYRMTVGPASGDPDARPIDPFRDEVAFTGIAAVDTTPPSLVEAYATGNATVLVRFSEPVAESAADPSRYRIVDATGARLAVSAVDLQVEGTRAALTTSPMVADMDYAVSASDVVDHAGNAIDPTASVDFVGVVAGGDTTAPRVTGATSTAPTRVLVTFSEPVRGGVDSAENPDHYAIVGSDTLSASLATQSVLDVREAVLSDDRRSVALTTLAQSEIAYTLRVSGIYDLSGNAVQGPTRDDPFEIEFFGSAESGAGLDSDGDGLTDAEEQRGWTVEVLQADGSRTTREVTSDPFEPDTDDDGQSDRVEKTYRLDPRLADTDDDGLSDTRELDEIYSEPAVVDSDGDGLADGLEVDFFTTSPLFVDTDGDQFDDGYEATTDNRDPRIADLPVVEIDVGNVDLQLDVRFEESSAEGTTTVDAKTVSSTLERSSSSRSERVESSTLEGFFSAYATGCYGGACDSGGETVGNWGISATVGGGFNTSETTTNTSESTRATQEAYESSLTTETAASAEASITRVVEGASMAVEVSITNPGNVAYTVRDIEITALIQNGRDAGALVPVATLVSATGTTIGVGPLNPTRGPFRFVADEAYPRLVEQLMQNPRGIVFRVANYTLEDEAGRRFAFVQQDVVDRTAGLAIDYAGNQPGESYRLATNGTFGPTGAPDGLSMADLLVDVLGLAYVPEAEDVALNPADAGDAELIDASYSTRIVDGVEVLYRVRDVSSELTGEDREWWVITSEDGLVTPVADNPGRDFSTLPVLSDTSFVFKFVQDLDGDGIEKAVEATYGSVDSDLDTAADPDVPDSFDTDDDGLADGVEPFGPFVGNERVPWTIRFDDGRDAYRTSANPARADTDFDGLTDCQELVPTDDGTISGAPLPCATIDVYLDADGLPTLEVTGAFLTSLVLPARTDPADIDTDDDGLTDVQEVLGFRYAGLDGTTIDLRPDGSGPATNPLSRDTDDDGLDDLREIRLGSDPTNGDEDSVLDEDGDGLVNLQETTGWEVAWVDGGGEQTWTDVSDIDDPDSDDDGLSDWEEYTGCRDANRDLICDSDARFGPTRPGFADTDADGLSDRQEVDGTVFPGDGELRFTDPRHIDSDGDGRSDGEEMNTPWTVQVAGRGGVLVWSDPLRADADGDGLSDAAELAAGSDPNAADTDGDGALDDLEMARGTDPLVPDQLVTVTYLGLQAGKGSSSEAADGDAVDGSGANPGDFFFNFQVRHPDPFSATGLSLRTVVGSWYAGPPPCTGQENFCRTDLRGTDVVQINAPQRMDLPYHFDTSSFQFSLPFSSAFTLEGVVQELDPFGDTGLDADHSFFFGGPSDDAAAFAGSDLAKGTRFESFSYDQSGVILEVTVQITVE